MVKRFISKTTIIVALLISFSSANIYSQNTSNLSIYKLIRFIQYVSSEYVDTVSSERIVDDAIIETLKKLDPHSVYITKEDVKAMNEPLEGNFEGIGVEFNILNDTLIVVNPIPGGPSERVGIMAGDRVIDVDGKNVAGIGLKNSDVFKMLRGDKGTQVTVQIIRRNSTKLLEFNIIRDKIPIHSLDASYMIDDKIGYIKLNRFALTTESEFIEALLKLKEENMQHLILDLRGNGGGYLNASVALADHFLEDKKLIVYTEGRNSPKTDFIATTKGELQEGRLIILIDEGSASASEIVAGAVQDWDRGIIIGRRSFGKGLVQNQLPLPDGSMVRLTVARYHTPTGRVIQKPYDPKELESYYSELTQRYNNGEFFHADSINIPDSLKYFTLNTGKVVYGGGGIMPDIFIPVDTSHYSEYYGKLIRKGIINQFTHTYIDKNRNNLKRNYGSFEKFNKNFTVNQNIIDELLTFAENQGLEPDSDGFNTSKDEILIQLKALIALNQFSTNYYFQIVNQNNKALQKAIDVLNSWDSYKHLVKD
ncbi:MAG: S41 family peptidase [Bacteroidales bacterium]|nr:S41 family peptidase [Bacteroidales bacterium]MDD3893109.1 S41 family peptidase [Bacteroidales bacterium]